MGFQELGLEAELEGCRAGVGLPEAVPDEYGAAWREVLVGGSQGGQEAAEGVRGADSDDEIKGLFRREVTCVLGVELDANETRLHAQPGDVVPGR